MGTWFFKRNLLVHLEIFIRNMTFDIENILCFQCEIVFISLINTKSDILTPGFAIRENTTFGVPSVK